MQIRQKVIWIVTASILLVAAPGIALIYKYVQHAMLATESVALEISTARIANSIDERFSQSSPKLSSLARILEKELAKPIQPSEIKDFYSIMEKNPDGVWRNRKTSYDGNNEAGIFLPTNTSENNAEKVQHLRIKSVMDIFGASASMQFENVWYLSLNRSEIIFDRALPEFVYDQKYDNDYTQTPWVTYTSPQLNPKREVKFTPPLYDPVPKVWMVSALYPLYLKGQWIGSLGEDMQLTGVLESMLSKKQRFPGTQHFLIDTQGNYVLAGPWQKQLEASVEAYQPNFSSNPKLIALLNTSLSNTPHTLSEEIIMQGERYVAIGVQLSPLDWKYFRLVPVNEILAPSHLLLYTLGALVLLITALTGGIIGVAMSSSVTRRIKQLSDAMQTYATDNRHRIASKIKGNDEISEANQAFNKMADDIDSGVAAKKKAENELQAAEELWRLALEGAGDGVWDWNIGKNEVKYSKRWKEIIGFAEDELKNNFNEFESRLHPEDRERVLAEVHNYFGKHVLNYAVEFRMRCKDGSYKWILARGIVASCNDNGIPQRMVGTHTDISQRKQAEHQLRISATAFESQEGMIVTDENNIILKVNHAFTRITGYSEEEAIGQAPKLLSSGKQDKAFYEAMWASIKDAGVWAGEIWNRRKNGEVYPEYLTITAVNDDTGVITNYVATFTDITLNKATSEEIKSLAFYDPLTKLPNRRLLTDRLQQALASSTRSKQRGALLFLDLDHFKNLNDSLGHDTGDLLLQQVADRLTSYVREGDTVARLGGDEFVVLLEDLSAQKLEAATQAEVIANKILSALNEPYQLNIHEYHNSTSIGVTLFCNHEADLEELLKQADIAMYNAKNSGRNTIRFFDPKMQEAINTRVNLENDLHIAIEQQQFELYYQIQVDKNGQLLGVEALIRWHHPVYGLLNPATFISLAEETGLILPIGQWVLEAACAQLQAWQKNILTDKLSISLNVSAKQFNQPGYVELVKATLAHYAVCPELLNLELTESLLLNDVDDIINTMNALQAIGIHFELDDFGTGYSSLQYLKKLPLYQLKIDQSFVSDITTNGSDQTIVRTIIAMAESLMLEVIAEGVETEEQLNELFHNGCTRYQGYLFGKPVPIAEFEVLLKKR